MKKLFLVCCAFCTAATLFTSCSSVNDTATLEINPSNSQNPFDYVGRLHNEGLRKTLDKIALKPDLNVKDKIEIAYESALEVMKTDSNTRSVTNDDMVLITEEEFMSMFDDMDNDYINFIDGLNVSPEVKSRLKDLIGMVMSQVNNEELTYNDLHSNIVNFEGNVIAGASQLSQDQILVLESCAVFRYSLAFWNQELTDTPLLANAAPKKRWWHWLIIGASDVLGGVIGGAVTVNGAGVVPGAVAGSGLARDIINDVLAE